MTTLLFRQIATTASVIGLGAWSDRRLTRSFAERTDKLAEIGNHLALIETRLASLEGAGTAVTPSRREAPARAKFGRKGQTKTNEARNAVAAFRARI
jgi:hypothetical protein